MIPSSYTTGGPARYFDVTETGGRVGFITPLTHTFCESCNRVRVTCTGTLYMCLGQEDAADLREPLRRSGSDAPLLSAIRAAIARKPGRPRFHHRTGGGCAGDPASYERDGRLTTFLFVSGPLAANASALYITRGEKGGTLTLRSDEDQRYVECSRTNREGHFGKHGRHVHERNA